MLPFDGGEIVNDNKPGYGRGLPYDPDEDDSPVVARPPLSDPEAEIREMLKKDDFSCGGGGVRIIRSARGLS